MDQKQCTHRALLIIMPCTHMSLLENLNWSCDGPWSQSYHLWKLCFSCLEGTTQSWHPCFHQGQKIGEDHLGYIFLALWSLGFVFSRFFKSPQGVKIQELSTGQGQVAEDGDQIELQYVLRRTNGYFIYSTVEGVSFQPKDIPTGPFEFKLVNFLQFCTQDDVLKF